VKGFTLIELMVVIFIFSVIMAATFGVLSIGRQSWHTGSTQVELQQETRRAMDRMVRELRESGSTHISIPVGGSSITFQVPIDEDTIDTTVDDDVLDVNGNIEWGAGGSLGRSIQYLLGGLNNRQLLRRVLNGYPTGVQVGADVILANNIRSDSPPPNALMFVGSPAGNPTVISIEVSAQKDAVPGRQMQSTLNSQVTLRNLRN